MTSNSINNKPKEPEQDVILVSGYKRSGKDTTSKMLKEIIEANTSKKVEIMSFAEPIKFIAKTIFNISDEQLDKFKNDREGIYSLYSYRKYTMLTDFREILPAIGNDALKPIFGNDVWVKVIKDKMLKSDAEIIIIPDFRFLVENAFENSVTIRVVNDNIKNDTTHPSETELDNFEFDFYLNNTGYRLTKELVKKEMNQQIDIKKKELTNG